MRRFDKVPIPAGLQDTSITNILAEIGVSHKRDKYTDTDRAHILSRKDGSIIGRYCALECVTKYDEILAIALPLGSLPEIQK